MTEANGSQVEFVPWRSQKEKALSSPLRVRMHPTVCVRALTALENEPSEAHIRWMENSRCGDPHPPQWEWEVTFNGEMVANGFEREQIAAKFEGYNALFLLLAAG